MYINRINKQTNELSMLWLILALGALILCMSAFIGCSAEKRQLKPYKAVNSDVDSSFHEKKKDLISRVCAVNFPIQERIITKDSIVPRIIKVQDNTQIAKLKALLAKGCPQFNVDSFYQTIAVDTCQDHYYTKTIIQKDTIGNYNRQKNEDALRNENNVLAAKNIELNTHIEKLNKDINKAISDKDYWKKRFFALLIGVILGVGVWGYFKLKSSFNPTKLL